MTPRGRPAVPARDLLVRRPARPDRPDPPAPPLIPTLMAVACPARRAEPGEPCWTLGTDHGPRWAVCGERILARLGARRAVA